MAPKKPANKKSPAKKAPAKKVVRKAKGDRGAAPVVDGNFNHKPMWLYLEHMTNHLNKVQMEALHKRLRGEVAVFLQETDNGNN